MKHVLIGLAACVALAGVAQADEQWATGLGNVVYEADYNDRNLTVWSYEGGAVFLYGLAGVYEGRGTYEGFWMEFDGQSDIDCGAELAAPDNGETSTAWGKVQVIFVKPDFPGSWVAQRGACFGPLEPEALVGYPITDNAETDFVEPRRPPR